ncbi:kinesin motor domain-containing protein [Phthorimaea operculella]|nr:kinesin motor domain-containing protein [Phthorimaea operculella]
MMGAPGGDEGGIIPRLCNSLFERISKLQNPPHLTYKVEVSYMEIYNERVHDLLDPETTRRSLRVREHAVLGPYVDGLSQLAVANFQLGMNEYTTSSTRRRRGGRCVCASTRC